MSQVDDTNGTLRGANDHADESLGAIMPDMWIAEEQVIFIHPNGKRTPGRIAVGLPARVDEVEAQCPVALDGMQRLPLPISGSSNLQALLLAIRFLGARLPNFTTKGGRVVDPHDDTDIALEAFFGPC